MSKKVDERVVEMRFDNQQFESATKQTMSTLDKLKAALKFPSSSKSLEGISAAAKKVDFSGMQQGIETVNAKFSAMQVVGMTALSNITSAAMRAGTNLVKSFTIDPIISGFQEYETQLNSVQTILANTSSKGTTIDDVTAALDELNTYADQTIYNFTEMTRNIGTFTAAGVDLDKSVSAIKGIANLAAVSGSSSTQASTAMYQLSQALAAGRVSLMDWNSVVNAGMGGEVFQNALKRTATVMGKDVDALIEKYGSFRESLTSGEWLTTDVLTETLKQFTMAAEEGSEQWNEFKKSLMDQGYTEAQATEILKMANTATDAATKVKTFTQMMDTLKEAMGSGWAKTWQLIFGDFEEAREFWTNMSTELGDMVNGFSDARNNVIEGAMGGGGDAAWDKFSAKIKEAGVSTEQFQKALKDTGVPMDELIKKHGDLASAMTSGEISSEQIANALRHIADTSKETGKSQEDLTKKLKTFQDVVNDVWMGDYKNGEERIKALTEAGYDYAEVQDLVNKTVDGHKLTLEDLSDAQLKAVGYTDDQIKAIRALADEAEKAGTPLNDLIEKMTRPSGRELFLESLTNLLHAILNPLKAVGDAFSAVFGIDSDGLYDLIAGFNAFTKTLVMDSDTIDNVTRTLKGLFAVIHLVATAAGKTFTIAFQAVNAILGFFGTNLLEVTAILGDALFSLDRWLTSGDLFASVLSTLSGWISSFVTSASDLPIVGDVIRGIGDAISWLKDQLHALAVNPTTFFENLSWEGILSGLTSLGSSIVSFFSNLGTQLTTVGPDIIAGLQNGLSSGWERVISFLTDLANKIVEAVKAVLGIQSPSTVFFEIGKNIIEGLVNGIKYLSGKVGETLTAIFEDISGALGTLDWGTILTVGAGAGTFTVFYKFTDALQSFGEAAENLTSPLEFLDKLSGSLDKLAKAKSFEMKADAIKNIAISIAILAGSLVVLSMIDPAALWSSVGALTVMGGVLAGIVAVTGHFGKGKKTGGIKDAVTQILDLAKLAGLMVSIGASMLMLAGAMAIIGSMNQGQVQQAGIVLAAFAGVVAALIAITKIAGTGDLDAAAKFVGKIGTAFLILAVTARLLGGMSVGEMTSAGIMLAAFTGVVAALIAVTKFGGEYMDYAAKFVSKVGTAFLLLAVTAKIMGGMSPGEMVTASIMLAAFTGVVAALVAVTKFAGKEVDKLSDFLLKVTAGFVLLGVAAKILGNLTPGEMIQAGIAIAAFVGVMAALVAITKLAPKDQIAQISTTLLAMSASIAILAAVAALLGMVPAENLVKGIAAVAALSVLVALLVKATKNAKDVKGTMVGIAIAIGVMAASIAVLSLLDPARVVLATACMSAVMGMFALIVKMGSNVQTSMGIMIVMVAAVAVLAAVLAVLANMPIEGVVASAISLSVVLLALVGAMKILDSVQSISSNVLIAVGVLTAVMAALGAVLIIMSAMNVQSAIPNAVALSTMLLAMSAAMAILDQVGSISMTVMGAMGILTAVMAGLGLVLAMMTALGVQDAIPNAIALSTLALAMSGVMAILSAIGPMAAGAIAAAGSMAAVIGIMAGIVAAAGAIAQIPGIDFLVGEGASLLQKIGEAIGGFIGGIVGGALEAATSTLPQVGQSLSEFAMNLMPFVATMKMIDPSITESCTNLAGAILALTGAGVIDAIASFFGAGSMIGSIGEQLVPFGQAMADFAGTLSGVDLAALLIGSQAAKAIADMANAMPKEGGILESIFGSTADLGTFGTQLTSFGDGMKKYAESIAGVDVASIQNSIPAAEGLAELANKLPAEGGLMQSIFGTQADLSTFGDQLIDFGDGLQQYASKVAGLNTESIEASIPAAEALNDLAQKLPSGGGLMESIFGGKDDLSDFGGQLTTFGQALLDYSNKVVDLNTAAMENSISATNAVLNVLRSYANADDIDTGIANANKIKDVGGALKAYSDQIAGVDPATITASASAINGLKDAINNLVGLDSSGIAGFQSAIDSLASTNVQGLIDAFQGVDLSSIGANIMTTLANGITAGTAKVTSTLTAVITAMKTILTVQAALLTPIGLLYTTNLAKGVRSGASAFSSALASVISSAVSTIRGFYSSFYSAGSYISSGLAAGMNSQLSRIRSAASQMAQAAAAATRAAAQVKSPSRVFMEIGDYMGQGLAIGMENEQRAVYKAGYAMGDSAYDGLAATVSRLGDVLSSDLDVNPTIRPVLDLSDVRNGANSINGMFNASVPMNIMGDISSINRSMNDRIQNGTFKDVVDAVDRLRSGLADIGGPSYTINGITYDDGSNIAAAIGGLTRAIRLEGRV